MTTTTVFTSNRTQAVRLPADVRLPPEVKRVDVRMRGQERIIAPVGHTWDSFFLEGPAATDDFMAQRASQEQAERESLDAACLADTNIVIHVIKRRPRQALQMFNEQAGHMAISVMTLAELLHGAEKSSAPREPVCRGGLLQSARGAALPAARSATLRRDPGSAGAAGHAHRRERLHIAAHARSEGLTLVTHNTREFERVPALQIEDWALDQR